MKMFWSSANSKNSKEWTKRGQNDNITKSKKLKDQVKDFLPPNDWKSKTRDESKLESRLLSTIMIHFLLPTSQKQKGTSRTQEWRS